MRTIPLKLITIIGESVLAERLPSALRSLGATGWTMTDARGDGSRNQRTSAVPGDNLRLEVVVDEAVAEQILAMLAHDYFPHYALVAWISEVGVLRGEKYRRA